MEEIRRKHFALLARPKKSKITQKYVPPKNTIKCKYLHLKRPILPIKNRRIEMLAVPAPRYRSTKYSVPEVSSTLVPRSALEVICTPRLDHLSRQTVRFWKACQAEKTHHEKGYLEMINDRLQMSLDTIYYHYMRSINAINAANEKPPKKIRYFDEFGDKERLNIIALPKKPPPPPRRKKRKWKKLEELKPLIDKLAVPNRIYKRPSQESYLKRLKVSPKALTYVANDRIKILARVPENKMYKPPYVPDYVNRAALVYETTERIKELAVPHPRAVAPDTEVKENPYEINPNALKYKPSPRILQLCKPVDR